MGSSVCFSARSGKCILGRRPQLRGGVTQANVLHDDARFIEARQGVLEELVGAV